MNLRQEIRERLDALVLATRSPVGLLVGRHGEILERSVEMRPEVEATLNPLPVERVWVEDGPFRIEVFQPEELMAHFPGASTGLFLRVVASLALVTLVGSETREAALRNALQQLADDIRWMVRRGPTGGSGEGGGGDDAVAFLSIKDVREN